MKPPSPAGGSSGTAGDEGDSEVLLTLPDDLRAEFKDPFGPVFTDARELLAEREGPLVAVGDVVTYHLVEAGRIPDVAVLDGYTERTPVDDEVGRGTGEYARRVAVENPAATLTAELLDALANALAGVDEIEGGERSGSSGSADGVGAENAGNIAIDVDGEEDLATLPAIVAAPPETSVVYGQPGEGMVHVPVAAESRARARELLRRMDGDHERVWDILGVLPR